MNTILNQIQNTQIINKDIDFTREIHNDLMKRATSKGFTMSKRERYFYTDSDVKRRKTFTEKWSKGNVVVFLNYYTVY